MAMSEDSRSRKWQITINNPLDKGFSHDFISDSLTDNFKNLVYFCVSDEIGEAGTFHTHIFFYCANAVRFSKVRELFYGGHFEMCSGSCKQNRDYIFKEGKYAGTAKEETNIKESHLEYGEMPVERQGKRNDLDDLYDMVLAGMSTQQIIAENPSYMLRRRDIDLLINDMRAQKFGTSLRDVDVSYIYGSPGVGKSYMLWNLYGRNGDYYRVSKYKNPFDGYNGQSVIAFEEFRSQFPMSEMLSYLDVYPLELPCRFFDKTACYSKVFIISNMLLEDQYKNIQEADPLTWQAFLRRIKRVLYFNSDGSYINYDLKSYFRRKLDFVKLSASEEEQVKMIFP